MTLDLAFAAVRMLAWGLPLRALPLDVRKAVT